VKVCVGVDVSAASLEVAWRTNGGRLQRGTFDNDAAGHQALIRRVRSTGLPVLVALEATGSYGLDLAMAMERASGIEVMVANPRTIADFGRALLQRSKTDRIDAETILLYVERMPFIAWRAPSQTVLELRAITRRIAALGKIVRAEKTRTHAAEASESVGRILRKSMRSTVTMLGREIAALRRTARKVIAGDSMLERRFELLTSIKGIGQISAIQILAELMLLPADMTDRQWVAHAGLDPRAVESGTSVRGTSHLESRQSLSARRALHAGGHGRPLPGECAGISRTPARTREASQTDPRRDHAEAASRHPRDVQQQHCIRREQVLPSCGGCCGGNVGNRVVCDFRGFRNTPRLTDDGVSHPAFGHLLPARAGRRRTPCLPSPRASGERVARSAG